MQHMYDKIDPTNSRWECILPVHDFEHLSSKPLERVIKYGYFGIFGPESRVRVAHYIQRRVPLQFGHCKNSDIRCTPAN